MGVPSAKKQVIDCFKSQIKFGSSKFVDKQELYGQFIFDKQEMAAHMGIYSENTAKNYINSSIQAFQYIRENHKVYFLRDIKAEHIKDFLDHRVTEVGYKTLKNDMSALHKLEKAINETYSTNVNFTDTINQFRQDIKENIEYTQIDKDVRAFSDPNAVINEMKTDTYKLAAEMQLNYGLRINEVAKIDLDKQLKGDTLTVQAKGGYMLDKQLSQEHITKLQHLSSDGIFQINKVSYGAEIKNACKAVNENYTGSHAFRHNYAENQFKSYAQQHFSMEECLLKTSQDLGHHRADITWTYLR